jgi:2-octaprenyl-6-methoxyphenol hydroxylase
MPQSQLSADVVIAGGGLNGLATAVALAGPASRRPLRCILVDAGDPFAQGTAAFDGRASAIALTSRRMLEVMGVWGDLSPHAQPVERIVVTDSGNGAASRPALLQFAEPGAPGPSAHIVENRYLYAALAGAAQRLCGLTVVAHTAVERFEADGGRARVDLGDGRQIEAALVVGADGRRSRLRQLAGIETVAWSYGQSAIVTGVAHERAHRGCAFEHFRTAGPFAILPLPGNRASLVWTETTGEAKRIAALDDEAFGRELGSRFGSELGAVQATGPRHVYPLGLSIAKAFRARRLALVGDAAHVVHPIAGLGFNLGLRDIAALAECLGDAVELGMDAGGEAVLARYESWRRFDTMMVAAATDGLNRLFSSDNRAIRLLRDAGLKAVDAMTPLKDAFMREAAGVTGMLPRLLSGRPA